MNDHAGEDPSPEERIENLRAWLLLRRREIGQGLEQELSEIHEDEGRHLADLEEMAGDVGADPSVFEHFRSSSEILEQIDEALDRIDEGTYTTCADCGEAIPWERLEALPFAALCIACKRKQESRSGF